MNEKKEVSNHKSIENPKRIPLNKHIFLDTEKFGDKKYEWATPSTKKVNIKIKKSDYQLIEYLQECYPSVSKTDLISLILHKILLKELGSIEQTDVLALIVERADIKAGFKNRDMPWTINVIGSQINEIVNCMLSNNTCAIDSCPCNDNSQEYLSIQEFLESNQGDK